MELNYKFINDDAIKNDPRFKSIGLSHGWYIRLDKIFPYINGLSDELNIPVETVKEIVQQYDGNFKIDPQCDELYCFFNTEEQIIDTIMVLKLIRG